LFSHAGIVGIQGEGLSPGVVFLLSNWGALGGANGSADSDFWLADTTNGLHLVGHLAQDSDIRTGLPVGWSANPAWEWRADEFNAFRSAALVRDIPPAPEPETWVLMVAGLLTLRFRCNSRRRVNSFLQTVANCWSAQLSLCPHAATAQARPASVSPRGSGKKSLCGRFIASPFVAAQKGSSSEVLNWT
jgi:hypothetical protein